MSDWRIEEFTVTEKDAEIDAMRAAFLFSSRRRYTPAGTYRRLTRDGKVIMSDTPDELRDLVDLRHRCVGNVLINGLGLGCAVGMALAKEEVTEVTVVEIDQQVIDLIAPNFNDTRLRIFCADALTWKSPKYFGLSPRWNVVWHDIWDDICVDNLVEMQRLHRRYGHRCDWQGSWCQYECQRALRN